MYLLNKSSVHCKCIHRSAKSSRRWLAFLSLVFLLFCDLASINTNWYCVLMVFINFTHFIKKVIDV